MKTQFNLRNVLVALTMLSLVNTSNLWASSTSNEVNVANEIILSNDMLDEINSTVEEFSVEELWIIEDWMLEVDEQFESDQLLEDWMLDFNCDSTNNDCDKIEPWMLDFTL